MESPQRSFFKEHYSLYNYPCTIKPTDLQPIEISSYPSDVLEINFCVEEPLLQFNIYHLIKSRKYSSRSWFVCLSTIDKEVITMCLDGNCSHLYNCGPHRSIEKCVCSL